SRTTGRRRALGRRDFMLMTRLSTGYRNYKEGGQSCGSYFSRPHFSSPASVVHGSAPATSPALRLIVERGAPLIPLSNKRLAHLDEVAGVLRRAISALLMAAVGLGRA